MTDKALKPGWSIAVVLLAAAAVGLAFGSVAGWLKEPAEVELAAPEAQTPAPLVRPVDVAPGEDVMAADSTSLGGIPPYPNASPRRLLQHAQARGGPMAVSWFSTPDAAEVILRFYEAAFSAQGREVVSRRLSDDMGFVGWLERMPDAGLAGGVLHMVSAIGQHGQTVVLLSASRPDMALERSVDLPPGLALPPGAASPQMIHLGEVNLSHEVIYSSLADSTPDEVLKFFRQHWVKQGFQLGGDVLRGADSSSAVAHRGPVVVAVDARREGVGTAFVITYEHRGER